MPSDAPIVLLHGFWHGPWCWARVAVELAALGRSATAVDMAGHGRHVQSPAAALTRPFDAEGFASAPSPIADLSPEAAGDLLVSQLERIGGGRSCLLVAHGMGGVVASRAVQRAPEVIAHVVYLCAVMPASGTPALTYTTAPENSGDLVPSALRADPAAIGALRLDPGSPDPEYRAHLRRAFYNDLDPAQADAAIALLSSDAPAAITTGTTELTAPAWGSVPRTYVLCTRDNAIRPKLQRRFITEADTAFPANPTAVVELDSSHSPFLSMPDRVASVIALAD